MPENADTEKVEELAKRVDELESQLEDSDQSEGSRPSRRGFLGILAASAGLGAAGVYGLSGQSTAATAQGYTKTGELRDGNDATLATLNNGGPFAFQVPVTAPELQAGELTTTTDSGNYHNQKDLDRWYFDNDDLGNIEDGSQARVRFEPNVEFGTAVIEVVVSWGNDTTTRAGAIKQFTAQIRGDSFGLEQTNTPLLTKIAESDLTWSHTGSDAQFDILIKNNTSERVNLWSVNIRSLYNIGLELVDATVEPQ